MLRHQITEPRSSGTSSRINAPNNIHKCPKQHRHVVSKLQKIRDKNLGSQRKRKYYAYIGAKVRITYSFISEAIKTREWREIFKVLKVKTYQSQILYSVKLVFFFFFFSLLLSERDGEAGSLYKESDATLDPRTLGS